MMTSKEYVRRLRSVNTITTTTTSGDTSYTNLFAKHHALEKISQLWMTHSKGKRKDEMEEVYESFRTQLSTSMEEKAGGEKEGYQIALSLME